MNLTYYGHSCFSVLVAGRNLLFDPFITGNDLAKGKVDINAIPTDVIFLSHGHVDHVQDVRAIAKRTGAMVVGNFEVIQWLIRQGVAKTNAINHGANLKFEFGNVKNVNAIHTSSMPDGSYGGNPSGYVVDTGEGAFYFSGDTALTMDMQLIAGS